MGNRWASGSIAGVAVQDSGGRDCRIDVLGGESFRGALVGDSIEALDLTVHTQITTRTGSGIHFGAHIAQLPIAKLNSIITAMKTAVLAGTSFNVTLSDTPGFDSINVACVPDFAAMNGAFYRRGTIGGGYAKDVVIQFIATAANT